MKYFVLLIGLLAVASCGPQKQAKKTPYELMVEKRYKESGTPPTAKYTKESQGPVEQEYDRNGLQEQRRKEYEASERERNAWSTQQGGPGYR